MKLIQPLPDMEKLAAALSLKHSVPGFTFAFIQNGQIIQTGATGIKNSTTGALMESCTMFEAASLTKTLFAVLVLRLADRGLIRLDQPVASLAPDLKISEDPRVDKITARQILSHGTGLPDWADKPLEFKFDPGTSYSYSGEGYYFLHKIVNRMTEKDFTEHLADEFFKPLGMTDSAAIWDASVGGRMTNKFEKNGEMTPLRNFVDLSGNAPEPNAAWSLYSGAEDYAKFMLAILNHQAGLSDAAFAEMVKPQNKADDGVFWGLGWGIPSKEPSVIWHWGENGGYRSLAAMDLESKDGFCIFCNSTGGIDLCIDLAGRLATSDFWQDIASFIQTAE